MWPSFYWSDNSVCMNSVFQYWSTTFVYRKEPVEKPDVKLKVFCVCLCATGTTFSGGETIFKCANY